MSEADELRKHREYECGRLAYFLNFGRDEYENEDLLEGEANQKAMDAWRLGWDESSASDHTKEQGL